MMSEEVLQKRKVAVVRALSLVKEVPRLGVGSGSTMGLFLVELSKLIKSEGKRVKVVPSSSQVEVECSRLRLELSSLYDDPNLDVVIDSADEVDSSMNLLKGGGAALTREKVLHRASDKLLIVVEDEKSVSKLCTKHPLPVEVLPFALPLVNVEIAREFSTEPRVRTIPGKAGPLVTDNGNYVLDVPLRMIEDPPTVHAKLKALPGVIETGIFPSRDGLLILGTDGGPKLVEMKAAERKGVS